MSGLPNTAQLGWHRVNWRSLQLLQLLESPGANGALSVQSDQGRVKTRVSIGEAYASLTHVKDLYSIKTHMEMDTFLLAQ